LTLEDQIHQLSDAEVENCLNRVLVGLDLTDSAFHSVLTNDEIMQEVIIATAEQAKISIPKLSTVSFSDEAGAIRLVLLEMVKSEDLRKNIEGALRSNRAVLFDPITASLVLAGIVALLSTDVTIKYENQKLSVKIRKEKTPKEVLNKFFALFK
jgi:hypothetical protein